MKKERQMELIMELAALCLELGWDMVIPETDDAVVVPGLIIGQTEFADNIANMFYGENNYSIYTVREESGGLEETQVTSTTHKKTTVH